MKTIPRIIKIAQIKDGKRYITVNNRRKNSKIDQEDKFYKKNKEKNRKGDPFYQKKQFKIIKNNTRKL